MKKRKYEIVLEISKIKHFCMRLYDNIWDLVFCMKWYEITWGWEPCACMNGLNFLTYSTYLEPHKVVIFGLQLYPKTYRGSWNLALMILGDTSTHNSHLMGKRLPPYPETNYIIFLHGDMKNVFLIIFLAQNLISSENPIFNEKWNFHWGKKEFWTH